MFNTILDNRVMLAESSDRDQTTVFVGVVPEIKRSIQTATAFYSHNNEEIKEGESDFVQDFENMQG